MYVKICGLRDADIALRAIELGADAVGVVMSPRSPRHASLEEAAEVVGAARDAAAGPVDTVLVVNTLPAREAAETARALGFDVLQLHGRYSAEDFAEARTILPRLWRATSLSADPGLRPGDFGEERLLIDGAIPGSGAAWDLSEIDGGRLGDGWILAGGLDPERVAGAIAAVRPWGVDVSSGVESSPGVKDPALIARFISAARA